MIGRYLGSPGDPQNPRKGPVPIDAVVMECYALGVHKFSIGILGASGYAGRELCRLVLEHPSLELAFASANSQSGHKARIAGRDISFISSENAPLGDAELVFSALPHGASEEWVDRASASGAKVVDLSSDLRPGNTTRSCVPYGLTELMRGEISAASIVANPGCYPTAVLIALAPLMKQGLTLPGATISISAASGVTGSRLHAASRSVVRRGGRGFPGVCDRKRAPAPAGNANLRKQARCRQ